MYIQMFILVRAAFFLDGMEMIQFHHKKTNKHLGESSEKYG